MINADESEQLNQEMGKELRGRLNEALLLIALIQNYEAAENSRKARSFGFRGRKDIPNVREGITTKDLADNINIAQSTAASIVRRLKGNPRDPSSQYVEHKKGEVVKTKERGRDLANQYLRHFHLLEMFFMETLGLPVEEAKMMSLKYMMLTSCVMIELVAKKFSDPKQCPCGDPIPTSTLCNG